MGGTFPNQRKRVTELCGDSQRSPRAAARIRGYYGDRHQPIITGGSTVNFTSSFMVSGTVWGVSLPWRGGDIFRLRESGIFVSRGANYSDIIAFHRGVWSPTVVSSTFHVHPAAMTSKMPSAGIRGTHIPTVSGFRINVIAELVYHQGETALYRRRSFLFGWGFTTLSRTRKKPYLGCLWHIAISHVPSVTFWGLWVATSSLYRTKAGGGRP